MLSIGEKNGKQLIKQTVSLIKLLVDLLVIFWNDVK